MELKWEFGEPYPTGSKTEAVPATVSGWPVQMPLARYGWEGERDADNREPEDQPGKF